MISKGADENIKDNDGYVALDYEPEDVWDIVARARQDMEYRRSKLEESGKNDEDEEKSSESDDEDTK